VGDTVVVIGSGYIALLTIAMLAHYPVKDIIVCGGFDDRLAMARRFGATVTVNTRRENAWERITDHTAKVGADVVIELTGRMDMLRLGASITKAKSRSRLVMAGVYGDEPFALGNYLQNRAPRLIAAYPNQSPNMMDDLRRGLWALEHGWLPQAELVTHRFSLADSQKGMELARTKAGGYIKGVIIPHAPLT
jgi:threonine dehydrogenase-like Zn-dependent dehydrogenase